MRLLGALLFLALVLYGALWLYQSLQPPQQTVQKTLQGAKLARDECRDLCEQTMILEKLDDAYLRRCRARCDADEKKVRDTHYEPIERITVAPARPAPPPPIKPR